MNDEFLRDNKDRYYFNLEEILNQTCPGYDYNKLKNYRDPDYKGVYKPEEIKKYNSLLKSHCDTQQGKVEAVLKTMKFDLAKYKQDRYYRLPIVIAELIYIISKEDSSKGSTISRLKTNNLKKLSYAEYFSIKSKLLIEIKKDYCSGQSDNKQIVEIREKCDKIMKHHEYLLSVYNDLKAIEERISKIRDKLYTPLAEYDIDGDIGKALSVVTKALIGNLPEDTLEKLKFDLDVLSVSGGETYDYAEFDDVITSVNNSIDNLEDELILVLKKE